MGAVDRIGEIVERALAVFEAVAARAPHHLPRVLSQLERIAAEVRASDPAHPALARIAEALRRIR